MTRKWSLFPAQDHRQRVRVERVLLAGAGSAIAVVVALAMAEYGYVPMRHALVYSGIVALLVIAGYALIRSGVNLKSKDPSLTVPFLISAALATSYLVYFSGPVKHVLFVIYVIAFLFGALTLPIRKLVWMALLYWCCYLAVVLLGLAFRPEQVDLRTEAITLGIYFVVLAWFAGFGWYIGNLRRKFRATNSEMAKAIVDLETLARIDGLTGCYNRRYAMEFLDAECNKPLGRPRPFSLCLVDVDHFKWVNDNYGHHAGDRVLQDLVEVVKSCLRGTDLLARYGGEEFLVILTYTHIEAAAQVCERMRKAAAAMQTKALPQGQCISISIGAAEFDAGVGVDTTLRRADEALYQAKAAGRDRIVCWPGSPPEVAQITSPQTHHPQGARLGL